MSYQSQKKASVRSTGKDLILTLAGLRSCFDMPQIYTTSIVKRSLYEEIKEKSGGCFYHSIIPDMYSVVGLCLSRSNYLRVKEPLFWVGSSNKSMGISDRIYRDAEAFQIGNDIKNRCVPLKISNLVSFRLHSNGFSAYYIYEALLQSPLKKKWHEGKIIRGLVMSSVLNEARKRAAPQKEELVSEIRQEAKKYDIPFPFIQIVALKIMILVQIFFFTRLPKLLFSRLGMMPGWIRFKSTNRKLFPTIKEASYKVKELKFMR